MQWGDSEVVGFPGFGSRVRAEQGHGAGQHGSGAGVVVTGAIGTFIGRGIQPWLVRRVVPEVLFTVTVLFFMREASRPLR